MVIAEPRRGRTKRSGLVAVVVLMGLLAFASACAKDAATTGDGSTGSTAFELSLDKEATAGAPQSGGQLSFGLAAESDGWNPYVGRWAGSAYIVGGSIFDPLVAIDPQGKWKPYLAESITPNTDFTEWKIKVRPGISFHNGQQLDSEAVRLNLQTGRESGLTALAFKPVTDLQVVDPLTVLVKLSQPWSSFPFSLATQAGYMAAPAQLQAPEGKSGSEPIGTGPYVFNSWVRDNSLKVRKNPNYWQNKFPYLDAIEFKVLADIQARGAALESGSVDAMELGTPDALLKYQDLAKKGEYQMYTDANTDNDETIIALNTTKPPFDDPIARKALATGLDQRELSDTSYRGAFPPAWGPFAENNPDYLSPEAAGYPKYDPAEARRLVEEYKSKHGGETIKFSALIPPDPVYTTIAQGLQQKAKEFGVEVELQAIDQATLINRVLTGDYQASGFVLFSSPNLERGYIFMALDPVAPPGLSLNFTRIDNPALRAAMDEARKTDDPAKQGEQYKIVQKELAKDLDKIFLVHNVGGIVYRNNVHGIRNTKFPGTEIPAWAGWSTTPFLTATWKDQGSSGK